MPRAGACKFLLAKPGFGLNLFGMSATEIISAIKKLPPAEQKKVFRFVEKMRDAQIKKEWDKEIARRLEEIDSGKVKLISAEKVFAKLRAKYG